MHQIKRAIIMAAGKGQRLHPVTLNTPKPLIDVNGTMMIETIITGLFNNNILEIYIVTGYLKERFEVLRDKYPELTFIENPYYDTCNNISSLYVAREHLEDVIILDGDQYIYNDAILSPYFKRSGYNAVWTDTDTNEWLMQINNEGIVTSCSRIGGSHGWQLYSISRWSAEDCRRLRADLEYEFITNNNRQIYWDDVAMFYHPEHYKLGIYEMNSSDIIEIDNLQELAETDRKYEQYLL